MPSAPRGPPGATGEPRKCGPGPRALRCGRSGPCAAPPAPGPSRTPLSPLGVPAPSSAFSPSSSCARPSSPDTAHAAGTCSSSRRRRPWCPAPPRSGPRGDGPPPRPSPAHTHAACVAHTRAARPARRAGISWGRGARPVPRPQSGKLHAQLCVDSRRSSGDRAETPAHPSAASCARPGGPVVGADPALPARVTVPGPCLALPVPPFLKMKVLTELEVTRGQSLGHRGLPPLGRVRLSGPCPAAAQVPAARCPLFPAPPTLSSLPLLLDLRLKPTPHQGHLKGHALYGTAPWALCAPEPSRLCCSPPFVCPDPPLGALL